MASSDEPTIVCTNRAGLDNWNCEFTEVVRPCNARFDAAGVAVPFSLPSPHDVPGDALQNSSALTIRREGSARFIRQLGRDAL